MPPKRKAGESDASEDICSYSTAFPPGPDTDLVVKSSDGMLFAVRSLHLRSASSILDDMLGIPPADDQEKMDGLPLVKLDEAAEELEILLRYIQPGRLEVNGKLPEPSWPVVRKLSVIFDKYDTPLVARFFLLEHLPQFTASQVLQKNPRLTSAVQSEVFAIAALHGLEDLAKEALRGQHQWGITKKDGEDKFRTLSHHKSGDPNAISESWRPSGLGDVDVGLIARLPATVIKSYSELLMKVMVTPGYSWLKAADDFKL